MDPRWPFALLHHTGITAPHYDLLIAVPGEERLRTWCIETPPESWPQSADSAGQPPARRTPDHRLIFLSYEGEISGGRGSVRRIAEGTVELISQTTTAWRVHLHSTKWHAFLILPLEIPSTPDE